MDLTLISSIYITLLFFLSGFNKITDFIQVVKGFMNKTKLPFTLCKIIIIFVILLEIVAPLIISLYSYNANPLLYTSAKLSLLGLIVFTILATFMYHFPAIGQNYYSFMSNISTIGGLLLLYQHFNF
uniref:DoxX family protein n=1 Tax=viral metagenome TaxID=1070528 RepID=A0A6C0IJ84_9ZZZZ